MKHPQSISRPCVVPFPSPRLAGLVLGLGLMLAPGISHAEISSADAAVLAGTCASCHGTEGRSPGIVPTIAGRPEAVLRAQLRAFRSEQPIPGVTVMDRIAKGYSDAEIDALARYFSQRPATEPTGGGQ